MNTFLNLIESNKKFPNYAAERRIDLLINYYLDDILKWKFNRPTNFVAPEFPIKHIKTSQADFIDYLSVFTDTHQPIFVELKTDLTSFKIKQAEKYIKNSNWEKIIEKLKTKIIKTKSDFRVKYFYLLEQLSLNNLIDFDIDNIDSRRTRIKSLINKKMIKEKTERSRLIIELSESIKTLWVGDVELVYIIPPNESIRKQLLKLKKFTVIDMKEIAENVNSLKNIKLDFSQLFNYLKTI